MKPARNYPRLHIDAAPSNTVGRAGGILLTKNVHASCLGHHLKQALAAWKQPFATHDPGRVLTDMAMTLVPGGDAVSDSSVLRDRPDRYRSVASSQTISRLIRTLAADVDQALAAINTARAAARARILELAGTQAPNYDSDAQMSMIIDLDATLATAHRESEHASPTYKEGFGFHQPLAFIDHGRPSCGEPAAGLLRQGKAGSNTATDHF